MTEAIYTILSAATGVTDLVSTRIYPSRLPLNTTYPAVTFQLVSDVPENQKTSVADYFNARVQINCFAVNDDSVSGYQKSIDIARAVRTAMERKTPGSYGGVTVINITLLNEFDQTDDNSDYEGVFFRVLEFNVCHG